MRDPRRIGVMLELLGIFWVRNPDMRFGQIVSSLSVGDLFYMEDDELEVRLRRLINGRNPVNEVDPGDGEG